MTRFKTYKSKKDWELMK
ncbi:KxYKxGKxW signal peptide domain-containing protein [Anabaena sp. PCC 7938]